MLRTISRLHSPASSGPPGDATATSLVMSLDLEPVARIGPLNSLTQQSTPQRVVQRQVLTRRDKIVLGELTLVWLSLNIAFWIWWAQPDHIVTWLGFSVASIALAYELVAMPAFFLFFVFKMRQPEPIDAPDGLRVAMVTAIVPSVEGLEVLERTLAGMAANRYPHDSWVLDEGGDPRVVSLCRRYGAHYWSRHGILGLNQATWPLQAKTKSGNYNGWLTEIGYEHYDCFVQLDTDHVPVPDYLDRVLGYFNDPDVAYVALPSVYSNLDDWPARGSSEQSQVFQGPMQMGFYGWARSPMIIGSHAAYRMDHLREIGGFGPSRAEDHLDTLNLVRAGHQGVFVPENLAFGLGPHTIADYLVQEHQWAFSIAQVFLKYARGAGRLMPRQRLLFILTELWYSRFALAYVSLYLLPFIALLTNQPIVAVPFLEFLLFSVPITLVTIAILAWCHHRRWFRPGTHFFMSWQGIVLTMARWPIVVMALINAVISIALRGGAFSYMVTPKGGRPVSARESLHVASPFIILATTPLVVAALYPWLSEGTNHAAAGYILFALMSSLIYGMLVVAVGLDHIRANRKVGVPSRIAWAGAVPMLLVALFVAGGIATGLALNGDRTISALTAWPGVLDGDDRPVVAVAPTSTPMEAANAVSTIVPTDTATTTAVIVPTATPAPTPTRAAATPTTAPTATNVPPTATFIAPPSTTSWLADTSRSGVTFGAYDPSGALTQISNLTHLWTAWDAGGNGGIPVDRMRDSYDRDVTVMLTLEPHPLAGFAVDDVISDINAGIYDAVIHDAARAAAGLGEPMLLRFGHEMDMNGLYPWAGEEPANYIAAWKYVVQIFREEGAANVIWVWSPAGALDSTAYFPGDDWVDYVGLTILQYSGWDLGAGFDPPREFKELINEKYQIFKELGKPVILAETGISLDAELKTIAVQQMIEVLPEFPQIRAVVYFNDQNPENAVSDERPVWTLTPEQIALLEGILASHDWLEPIPGTSQP